MNNRKKYSYNGPVMRFKTCVKDKWTATTFAATPEKAKSNLAFRFKIENGFNKTAKILLPGEIKLVS